MCPRTMWPLANCTRNIVPGRTATTVPSSSIAFGFWAVLGDSVGFRTPVRLIARDTQGHRQTILHPRGLQWMARVRNETKKGVPVNLVLVQHRLTIGV